MFQSNPGMEQENPGMEHDSRFPMGFWVAKDGNELVSRIRMA